MGEVIDLAKHREVERRPGAELEELAIGELVDDEARIPVNPPAEDGPKTLHGKVMERAEVRAEPWVTPWLRVPEARRDVVRYYGARSLHACVFHALRTPVYAAKVAGRAPVGLARATKHLAAYTADLETTARAVAETDNAMFAKLMDLRDQHATHRRAAVGGGLLAALAALALAWVTGGTLARLALVAALALGFGLYGRRRDKPIISRAVSRSEAVPLTDEVVVQALVALRIVGISDAYRRDPERAIRFVSPITRDGKGWRVEVELPPGVKALDVVDKREELAGALARPLGCVWPEVDAAVHPGRLVLWVGDQAMATSRQAPWPLLKSGTVDLFKPIPFGTNQRNRVVTITLMFASMVVGSVPRVGKTAALRLLLVTAALDPRAELHIYDLKGTGDFRPLKPVAHRYRAGARDEDVEYLLADARELAVELDRRVEVIDGLPEDAVPDAKVTPDLPARHRLHPIVFAVDECQRAFEHEDYGPALRKICEDLVRVGPAVGIISIFATQRPDKKSLPTGISGNAILRFCLKVMGQVENDMILGTSSYQNGVRATMFSRRDLGIGYLAGEGEDPMIVRTFYLDAPAAKAVIKRAHAARLAAGTLTGFALGEDREPEEDRPRFDLLTDLLACVKAGEDKVRSEVLCEALAELRPDAYVGWDQAMLGRALSTYGIATCQINRDGVNRRGVEIDVLRAAVAERSGGGE